MGRARGQNRNVTAGGFNAVFGELRGKTQEDPVVALKNANDDLDIGVWTTAAQLLLETPDWEARSPTRHLYTATRQLLQQRLFREEEARLKSELQETFARFCDYPVDRPLEPGGFNEYPFDRAFQAALADADLHTPASIKELGRADMRQQVLHEQSRWFQTSGTNGFLVRCLGQTAYRELRAKVGKHLDHHPNSGATAPALLNACNGRMLASYLDASQDDRPRSEEQLKNLLSIAICNEARFQADEQRQR